MITAAVYLLGAIICLASVILLIRGYMRSRSRLLMWSALCFVGLAVANLLLYADAFVFPTISLRLAIDLTTLAGGLALLYGLIWEARD